MQSGYTACPGAHMSLNKTNRVGQIKRINSQKIVNGHHLLALEQRSTMLIPLSTFCCISHKWSQYWWCKLISTPTATEMLLTGDLLLYLKLLNLNCLCSWQFQYKLNTHCQTTFNTSGQQQLSFTWLTWATWRNGKDIYISISSHTSQTIGIKLAEWKKVLTDYGKYKRYCKIYTTYFQKFKILPQIRQQKCFFSLQRTGSFQTMYFQEIQIFWHYNIQTVQLLWLHLQHQSVLEEGQTKPSPTADSSTYQSAVTACGNKRMSSQPAYEDFLLFPSPIWQPDKEKYLLLRDCH